MCCGIQAVYSDGLGPIRGVTDFRDSQPDVDIALTPGDILVSSFGYFNLDCCDGTTAQQLGFRTANGAQYGPYGGPISGTPFSFRGRIYGFFGILAKSGTTLAGIGFWTDAPPPPPSPPARSPPVAQPPPPAGAPSPPPARNLGRIQSFGFGDVTNNHWDDGAYYSRTHSLAASFCSLRPLYSCMQT
jgi:hypothetical protein